ncbi:hypothetical protein OIU77_030547 [Salix suchowensis]|uniref:Uncharacterized protein n=1 Tax=Salix suchowensis TaxID=1278906 RepID=A0ABQ9BEE5_9ROSI|nr:hypothetical protein OIU77_030547 [Salix suchowensis]
MFVGVRFSMGARVAVALALALIFLSLFADCANNNDSQVKCSRTCVAQNCNSFGIRYGKYCGVGWSGCPGEKPCDDVDACCKIHDECVEKKEKGGGGLMFIDHAGRSACRKDLEAIKMVPESWADPTFAQVEVVTPS